MSRHFLSPPRILLLFLVSWYASPVAQCHADLPLDDIFEVRPPRVRGATTQEVEAHSPLWYNFFETLPPSEPRSSVTLEEGDQLSAVFPARNIGNSDHSIYEVASLDVDGFSISLDYYIFDHPASGTTDWISPASEQAVLLGALPAGDYAFNLRYWYLAYDDQFGFDPSAVPRWSPPQTPVVLDAVPPRYYTDLSFSFAVAVPEPSAWILGISGVVFFMLCRLTNRCS